MFPERTRNLYNKRNPANKPRECYFVPVIVSSVCNTHNHVVQKRINSGILGSFGNFYEQAEALEHEGPPGCYSTKIGNNIIETTLSRFLNQAKHCSRFPRASVYRKWKSRNRRKRSIKNGSIYVFEICDISNYILIVCDTVM